MSSDSYAQRRSHYRRMLTVYGRNAVLEALADPMLDLQSLHVAVSNRPGGQADRIVALAQQRGVTIKEHTRDELSRISRNAKQDQGVALDVRVPGMQEFTEFLVDRPDTGNRLLALDGVTNPQNLGMAIRSAVAAGFDGILHADQGNPRLGPLVIKASSGTLFRAPLLRCSRIEEASEAALAAGFSLYRLDADGQRSLFTAKINDRALFVLGGETSGVSQAVRDLPGEDLSIPMAAGVESLNVAVTAALVGYAVNHFDR